MYGEDPREPPFDYDYQPQPEPKKRYGGYIIGALALVMFVGGIWVAYRQGVEKSGISAPPLIKAEQGPTKIPPEHPGGMRVPNQDKTIYNHMDDSAKGGSQAVERLLPPPEQPAPAPPPAAESPGAESPISKSPASGTPPAAAPAPPPAAPVAAPPPAGTPAASSTKASAPAAAAAAPPTPAPAPTEVPLSRPLARPAPPSAATATTRAAGTTHTAGAARTAEPAPTAGEIRIQLGAFRDQGAAHRDWLRLTKRYPDLLGHLHPSVSKIDLGSRGVFQRLQAGPLRSREQAVELCNHLKARKQGCIVVAR